MKFQVFEYLQVGSVDHHIHYYDLRNISQPLYVFGGHKKAVSYVKFLSNNELASASTDSTLRLWDVKENLPVSRLSHILEFIRFINCEQGCYISQGSRSGQGILLATSFYFFQF